jgi:hypothetical protein
MENTKEVSSTDMPVLSKDIEKLIDYKESMAEFRRLSRELDYVNKNISDSFSAIKLSADLCNEKLKELEEIKRICLISAYSIIALIITIIIIFACSNIQLK